MNGVADGDGVDEYERDDDDDMSAWDEVEGKFDEAEDDIWSADNEKQATSSSGDIVPDQWSLSDHSI